MQAITGPLLRYVLCLLINVCFIVEQYPGGRVRVRQYFLQGEDEKYEGDHAMFHCGAGVRHDGAKRCAAGGGTGNAPPLSALWRFGDYVKMAAHRGPEI
ncbi:hypothetical protein [uncultured Pluralibacter sp.]|uniref:hypothetical protein n=1 Tax=uncultured Pluralibacter sp. TaxID=1490864 RepID=UPI002629661F|nr:hypothetical protein [uncultured Pluralibacter sp.]